MINKKLKIINKLGVHARAAMKLSDVAARFQSEIIIRYGNREANAKSIMDVMILAASFGAEIELLIAGDDENEAMQAIEKLIAERFGEYE
jgi:phosphocarrier protein